EHLSSLGFQIGFLHGMGSQLPEYNCELIGYTSFNDLSHKRKQLLSQTSFDAIIHAAAVSDYTVKDILINGQWLSAQALDKISLEEDIQFRLTKNPKLIDSLREFSQNKEIQIIGFKLTVSEDKKNQSDAIQSLFDHSDCDLIVHNDLKEMESLKEHHFHLYQKNKFLKTVTSKKELAQNLYEYLKELV